MIKIEMKRMVFSGGEREIGRAHASTHYAAIAVEKRANEI